jgi:hypothetical protein
MKKCLLLILFYILFQQVFCQFIKSNTNHFDDIKEKTIIPSIQLTSPIGTSLYGNLEVKLLNCLSVNVAAGIIGMKSTNNAFLNPLSYTETEYNLVGFANIEPRLYFNLGRRKKLNRNIKNLSGNYIGFRYLVSSPALIPKQFEQSYYFENAQATQINLGTKHQLSKHVLLGAHIGYVLWWDKFNQSKKGPDLPMIQFGETLV